ncbi:MAG: hypothetical protein HRF50_15050 [Phycisphaerae bacterium]|jgi:hypothetical protein
MANERQSPDTEFTAENEIDLVLGNANPNPERAGCPPRDVLVALARRERPATDPAYDHLIKCSPCYREVRALQQAAGERRLEPTSRSWRLAAAAALLLAVVGGGVWVVVSRSGKQPTVEQATQVEPQPQIASPAPETVTAQIDLRPYRVLRSDAAAPEQEPVLLPRGRITATILLPVGSEPGEYETQILDSDLRSRAAASGVAEIRNFVTTLQVTLEIESLPPGAYQLAVRRQGQEWRLFPARVW